MSTINKIFVTTFLLTFNNLCFFTRVYLTKSEMSTWLMPNLLFRFTAIKKNMAVVGLYFKGELMAVKVLRETG